MFAEAVSSGVNDLYQQARQEYARKRQAQSALQQATLSGAGTGAVLGGMSKLLGGSRDWRAIALRSLLGAGAGAGIAGGSNAVGQELLGPADDSEPTPFTVRGALGGLVGGGLLGAGAGALLGAGKLGRLAAKLPDNLITEKLAALASRPGAESAKRAAMLGGAIGGGVSAYQGADEGMQVDFLRNQALARRRRVLDQLASEGAL